MKAEEFTEGTVFARSPKGLFTMKFRCDYGPKAGRIVKEPADCGKPKDPAKMAQMRKTRARTKIRQARKAKFAKKVNVGSRIIARLNKFRKRTPKKKLKRKFFR